MASACSVLAVFVIFFSAVGASLLEPKHPCVPLAVARGPCHECTCSEKGLFHCRAVPCRDLGHKAASECEPYKLYRDEYTICECSGDGRWISRHCQDTFRYVQAKGGFGDRKLKTKVPCEPGNLYLIGCNVCKCPSFGTIEASGCSSRRCTKGSKTKSCKYGDLLKTQDELCSCSDANVYIDRLCISISNKSVQYITPKELAPIIDYGKSWAKEPCARNKIYWLDCNRCSCDDEGDLHCTNNVCSLGDDKTADNGLTLRLNLDRDKKMNMMPELMDENARCQPGHSYRVKCNTCVCSTKGKLTCTTMICWNDILKSIKPL